MVELYDPYANMESWTGVPDYGGNYGSYMGQQSQPLSMNQLISMVRQLQQGMQPQPIGNQSVSVSNPTLLNIPAQIQANITDLRNRLMSMPKPPVMAGDTFTPEPTSVPVPGIGQAPVAGQTSGGGGGGGTRVGNVDYGGGLQPLSLNQVGASTPIQNYTYQPSLSSPQGGLQPTTLTGLGTAYIPKTNPPAGVTVSQGYSPYSQTTGRWM